MNTEKLKKALEELVTLIEQADTFEWRGTYIGYLEESKDRAKELLAAPPSYPTGEPKANAVFNRREVEDKENIAELKEILSSSPTATAEDFLNKIEDRHIAFVEDYAGGKESHYSREAVIKAMTEYSSLKEQQFKESLIKDLLLTVEEEKHVIQNPTDYDYRQVEDARKIYNTVKNAIKIIEGKK